MIRDAQSILDARHFLPSVRVCWRLKKSDRLSICLFLCILHSMAGWHGVLKEHERAELICSSCVSSIPLLGPASQFLLPPSLP